MPVPDFAHGVKDSSYWLRFIKSEHTKTAAAKTDATQTASTDAAKTDSGNSFFDDVLDVVNPLQHLPIVGTVYRAITGDKIGDVEKVAGDTLYGGPIGLVSSLADVAFEKITGKDFGDTVMAFVGLDHSDSNTVLAANTPKPTSKAAVTDTAAAKTADTATKTPMPLSQLASITPIIPTVNITASPAAPEPEKRAAAPSAAPIDISANTDALLSALARNGVTGQMQTQALDAYRRTMSMNAKSALAPVN
jgi:hypothetical protein